MEGRRRQRWDNHRRSQNIKPPRPRRSWQPTVPSWEKEFCKAVGSLDWETFLQKKKFMHLYGDVLKWNDSAGEEAFWKAKNRYWAEINGFYSDTPLPDPDLYLDKIDWDSEIGSDPFPDLESNSVNPTTEDHDPVVIFGDSLIANQSFSVTGWGDDEENFNVPANHFHSHADYGAQWAQGWGDYVNNTAATASAWPGYYYSNNNAWQSSDGSGHGYMAWGGGWNYANNNFSYVGPDVGGTNIATANNVGRHVSSHGTSRVEGNDHFRNRAPRNERGRNKAPYWRRQSDAITVGQVRNQKKPVP